MPTKKVNKIFVQIAAYRDPELKNTIADLLEKANNPDNLRIAIAWQHSPYEEFDDISEYKNDPRFDIIDIDYRDAKGPCYARYLLNQRYTNEKYMLQLDSHHRFVRGWDDILIVMLESLRSKKCKKPLLTSYLPSYDPKNDPDGRMQEPWIMEFDRFAPESPVHFLPRTMDEWKTLTAPLPGRFASGHFIFTDGKFCKEVPYDPNYYFHGEEINLSVRAFMAGYDIFAPHKVIIWHEYTRDGKKKHWDDHKNWDELDKFSHNHNKQLFGVGEDANLDILQQNTTVVRSLRDYELYAGIDFKNRKVHKDTLAKKIPPVSLTEEQHTDNIVNFQKVCIDLYKGLFELNDYTFWAVALEDKDGKEIYRNDASADEIKLIMAAATETDNFYHLWRNFYSDSIPASWVVWPHSASAGWSNRLTGKFNV